MKKGGDQVKAIIVIIAILFAVAFVGNVMAVPSGKTVEFADGDQGKVVFDGKVHADAGLKCNSCHPKLFKMKKGGDMFKMADINAGKFCGECHNGTKAFKADDAANCAKCHKK